MNATNRLALLSFMQHLLSLDFSGLPPMMEIGDMFAADATGWRVYIKVGDKALALDPKGAEQFADLFERHAGKPENATLRNWALDNAKVLRDGARATRRKNRDKIVPDGYAEAMPTAGRA